MLRRSIQKLLNRILAVAVTLVPFFTNTVHASICDKLLRGLNSSESRFAEGETPNLEDPVERAAFFDYIQSTYAFPDRIPSEVSRSELNEGLMIKIRFQPLALLSHLFHQHPELAQKRFLPDVEVDTHYLHEVTPEVVGIRSIHRNASELNSRLLNPAQNRGFWERLLGSVDASPLFEDGFFRPNSGLSDPSQILFFHLRTIREDRIRARIDVTEISKIMAGLVWTLGSRNIHIDSLIASNDGYYQMAALKIVLAEREKFAQSLGFKNYNEILSYLGVRNPPGLPMDSQLPKLESAQRVPSDSQFIVRHLSAAESVFRGCLGGDCSTASYFDKALDPNYHYFTLGFPQTERPFLGHVTVVLGTADGNRSIAYVDKIQGVPLELIPSTLEAIRQSVASINYELAIPTQLGWHSGISNSDLAVVFIENKLTTFTSQDEVIHGFIPHPQADYGFRLGGSTAERGYPVKPLLPLLDQNNESDPVSQQHQTSSFTVLRYGPPALTNN